MKNYLDLEHKILKNGQDKGDRTGTGTISLFGEKLSFDLKKRFPILTTKKVFFRGVVEELLWFLKGSTDVTYLEDRGIKFWSAWKRSDGTIGEGYGTQMRKIKFSKSIKPKILKKPRFLKIIKSDNEHRPSNVFNLNKTGGVYSPIGIKPEQFIIAKNSNSMFRVIEEYRQTENNTKEIILGTIKILGNINNKPKEKMWLIQFKDTNTLRVASSSDIMSRNVEDNFSRNYSGVGYLGNTKNINLSNHIKEKLYIIWKDILSKCYNKLDKNYIDFGAKDHFVSREWHNFTTFCNDAKNLPGWESYLEWTLYGYRLDKNILYASNCYSKETCMWASGKEIFANKNDEDIFNETVIRHRQIDQLSDLIASLKHNPNSRRHIISLWNSHDIDYMELPPCHGDMIQFYINDGELSCQMYQRSADIFLGVPFNISSYALLTLILSQICDLKPGKLDIVFGDVHIYKNHIEQVKEQISRKPKKLPKINIDKSIKNINDFTFKSFKLIDYSPLPNIKGDISI